MHVQVKLARRAASWPRCHPQGTKGAQSSTCKLALRGETKSGPQRGLRRANESEPLRLTPKFALWSPAGGSERPLAAPCSHPPVALAPQHRHRPSRAPPGDTGDVLRSDLAAALALPTAPTRGERFCSAWPAPRGSAETEGFSPALLAPPPPTPYRSLLAAPPPGSSAGIAK